VIPISLTLLSALCGALALPPFDCSAFAWAAPALLLLAVRRESVGGAFRLGLLWGYLYGWATTWSIAEVGAQYFGLPFPLAMAGFALYYLIVIGIPYGIFTAGSARVLRTERQASAQFLIPLFWVVAEFVRSRVFEQPWAVLGYSQHDQPALIQVAAVTGVYGVSYLVVLGGTALADAVWNWSHGHGVRSAARALAVPAFVIGFCWLGGAMWLHINTTDALAKREVAIVQTNVSPARHWTRSYTQSQVRAHLAATDALPPSADPALVVWPENAVPRYLETEPMLAVQLANAAVRHHADLLFGAPRYEAGKSFNSARLITAQGHNGGYYDKRRLVLFAEEKPLAGAAGGAPGDSPEEFTSGSEPGVLQSFVRIGVSICHEITHPDLIVQSVRDGAELLVNIANDGWLDAGSEFAGRQHLAMAVFRAVETRRYLVRASTTGPSAAIDPYGRLLGSLSSGTSGVLRVEVSGVRTTTPYVRFGDLFAVLSAAIAGAVLFRRFAALSIRVPLLPATLPH
jgi:apolipoprotein N-acyltransferase